MKAGSNIRALRQRENLSQAELASLLNVAKETISRWETNRIAIRPKHVDRIIELFKIERDDLLSEERGLASSLESTSNREDPATTLSPNGQIATRRPIYQIERTGNGTTLRARKEAYIPEDVARQCPTGVLVRIDGHEMNRLYPAGSLLLVDRRIRPYNGCSVVALVDGSMVVIRRYASGNNTIVLSSWSHDAVESDMVLDKRRVRTVGVVVYFQAERLLAQ